MSLEKKLTVEKRKWIYNIALAVLVLLGGYGVIDSVETANYANLITAVLNIGGAAAVGVARNNLTPDEPQAPEDINNE